MAEGLSYIAASEVPVVLVTSCALALARRHSAGPERLSAGVKAGPR